MLVIVYLKGEENFEFSRKFLLGYRSGLGYK